MPYVDNQGVRIHYHLEGEGPLTAVALSLPSRQSNYQGWLQIVNARPSPVSTTNAEECGTLLIGWSITDALLSSTLYKDGPEI